MFLGLTLPIRRYTVTFLSLILDIYSYAEVQSASFCFSIRVRLKPTSFCFVSNILAASLLPRKGRDKPGSEGDDLLRGVAGEAGQYGCLAVDNLYNIMHTTDRKWIT